MRTVDTFFRGYRRETIIDGASILCNAAGEKRLKLSMKLPLSGDQLVGMPSWVGEPFNDIAKPEFAVKAISSTMELDPMNLHVFVMPQSEKEVIQFDGVRLCSFKIDRDSEDEHPLIVLRFTAYLPRTGRLLKFADDNFGSSLFIKYEAAQQSLLDDNPNIQPTAEPPADPTPAEEPEDEEDEEKEPTQAQGDPYEAERRIATSPAMDKEFEVGTAQKQGPSIVPPPSAPKSGARKTATGKSASGKRATSVQ